MHGVRIHFREESHFATILKTRGSICVDSLSERFDDWKDLTQIEDDFDFLYLF